MGICCCRPPDDDDVTEAKPVNEKGNYGAVKESQGRSDSSEGKPKPGVTFAEETSTIEDKHALLEGPEEATEATPLLESPDADADPLPPRSLQPHEERTSTEGDQIATAPMENKYDAEKGQAAQVMNGATSEGQRTPPSQTTTIQSSRSLSESSSDRSIPAKRSQSEGSVDEPVFTAGQGAEGGMQEQKKRKSVGKKIKKKFGKLGKKRKSSSQSGESDVDSRSRSPSDPAKSDNIAEEGK